MLRSRTHVLQAVVILLALGGCSATGPISDLTNARQRWQSGRPAAYEYTLRMSCFCGGEVTRPVVIVVSGNAIQSRNYADTGEAVSSQWSQLFPTIDGLFDVIASASAHAAALDAFYDPSLGYPTSISIDYASNVADDEITYAVTGFHVR